MEFTRRNRLYEAYTGECLVNYTTLREHKVRSSIIRMLYTVWDNLKISLSIFIICVGHRNMHDIGRKVLGATFIFQAFWCLAALPIPLDFLCSWNCHWRICDSHPFLFIILLCILAQLSYFAVFFFFLFTCPNKTVILWLLPKLHIAKPTNLCMTFYYTYL